MTEKKTNLRAKFFCFVFVKEKAIICSIASTSEKQALRKITGDQDVVFALVTTSKHQFLRLVYRMYQ